MEINLHFSISLMTAVGKENFVYGIVVIELI